eukprot:TRINITY_DN18478_c0_g1_i1.p1 TRINITY_DN18478_c0_g1~~TRINITY_DN18478_c0_g1_i1.p1  ORF type:complete len:836 (-),score=148.04 TRINITY_DN18478_c0_g1_i1:45-2552(-)
MAEDGVVKARKEKGEVKRWIVCFPKKANEVISVKHDEEGRANSLLQFIRSLSSEQRRDKEALKSLCREHLSTLRRVGDDEAASEPESDAEEPRVADAIQANPPRGASHPNETMEEAQVDPADEAMDDVGAVALLASLSTRSAGGASVPPDGRSVRQRLQTIPEASSSSPRSKGAETRPAVETCDAPVSQQHKPTKEDLDQLKCTICFEDYDDGRHMPVTSTICGHTVSCKACIARMLSNLRGSMCPLCRKPFTAGEWKPNFGLASALAGVRSLMRSGKSASSNTAPEPEAPEPLLSEMLPRPSAPRVRSERLRNEPGFMAPQPVTADPGDGGRGRSRGRAEAAMRAALRTGSSSAIVEESRAIVEEVRTTQLHSPRSSSPPLAAEPAPQEAATGEDAADTPSRASGRGRGRGEGRQEGRGSSTGRGRGYPSGSQDSHGMESEVQVPPESVSVCLLRTQALRQVEEEFGVRVEVVKENGKSTGKLILRDYRGRSSSLGCRLSTRLEQASSKLRSLTCERTIEVPVRLMGKVIGSGGAVISSLQDMHGVTANRLVSPSSGVKVMGKSEGVEACARTISNFVEKNSEQSKELEFPNMVVEHILRTSRIEREAVRQAEDATFDPFPQCKHWLKVKKSDVQENGMAKLAFQGTGAAVEAGVDAVKEKTSRLVEQASEVPAPGDHSVFIRSVVRDLEAKHSVSLRVSKEVHKMEEAWMEANELPSPDAVRVAAGGEAAACEVALLEAFEAARQQQRRAGTHRTWQRHGRSRSPRRDSTGHADRWEPGAFSNGSQGAPHSSWQSRSDDWGSNSWSASSWSQHSHSDFQRQGSSFQGSWSSWR